MIKLTDEEVRIPENYFEFRLKANKGWAAAQGKHAVVVLDTELTPELIRSGYARELNRFVQDLRKARDLERTDRIDVWIKTNADEINQAIDENVDYLKGETLAVSISQSTCDESGVEPTEVKVGDHEVTIWIRVAK